MKQTINSKQVTGIILCGGKSSRMGQNKALLSLGGKPIISQVLDTLKPFCNEVLISTNNNELAFLGYPIIKDVFEGIGPIAGILSALQKSKNETNIILSCDTPFVNKSFIHALLDKKDKFDVVLPEFEGYLQPMTGMFKKEIAPIIEKEIAGGNFIPPRIFEQCNLYRLKIDENSFCYHKNLFFNINSPADYQKAKEIIKGGII